MNTGRTLTGEVFITGGTGTLGSAIIDRAWREGWDCQITVYSRNVTSHAKLTRTYPGLVRTIPGDIRDYDRLYLAMIGHNIVIHAAAQKHIGVGESHPIETHTINVTGSENVIMAAAQASVKQIILVSTDKAAYAGSVYGSTKRIMESLGKAASKRFDLKVNMVRYGNVLGSNGSVLAVWSDQFNSSGVISLTDPSMTRFWLSVNDAVDLVVDSTKTPSGSILIPLAPASTVGDLARSFFSGATWNVVGRRPGEKSNECLISDEEAVYCMSPGIKHPNFPYKILTDGEHADDRATGYYSDDPHHWLTDEELRSMLDGGGG